MNEDSLNFLKHILHGHALLYVVLILCFLGLLEVKKVDILWNDQPKRSKVADGSSGELYLKVSMVGKSGKKRLWSMLLDSCIQIMNVIDWSRSHPDNVHEYCLAYGIDVGWNYFLNVRFLCFFIPSQNEICFIC